MFIKKSWFTKNGKKYITYQIAKSYRPKGGKNPRTKILATITHLPKPLIDKIALLLKSPTAFIISDLYSFFKESYIFAPILFLYLFMKRLGIIGCLKNIPRKSRLLLIAVILNRILDPRSKLGSVSWVKTTAFSLLFGIEKHRLGVNQIYQAMDLLYQRMDKVLDNFFQQNKAQTLLLLYDITSIFFEGLGPKELARFGYSRDEKPGNPQILLTLCLNEQKLPIYFDIIEGNIQDKKTVIPFIKGLRQRFELHRAIFIGDRGMIDVGNIKYLEGAEGVDYIVALTHREARELIFSQHIQPELFDEQVPITILVAEAAGKKRRYVLCGSKYRKVHDQELLAQLLKRGKEGLEGIKKMVTSGRLKDPVKIIRRAQKRLTERRAGNFYDFKLVDGKFEIIEKTAFIEKARALCGYYILQTTVVGMEDKEVESHYKQLKFVEDSFRQLKELVEIKPIYHWKDRRVRVHIFLCILAQTVVNKVREHLKQVGWLDQEKENSLFGFLDILYKSNVGIFDIQGAKAEIITQLTPEMKKLLKLFNLEEKWFSDFGEAKRCCRLN